MISIASLFQICEFVKLNIVNDFLKIIPYHTEMTVLLGHFSYKVVNMALQLAT